MSAVKKNQVSKDTTGGWGRYNQLDWRSHNEESQSYQDQVRQYGHGNPSEDDQYVYFWGQNNFYSHWYPTEFEVNGKRFRCAQQYTEYMKAVVFQDDAVAQAILRTRDPNQMKKLGRKVKGFDKDTWQKYSLQFVKEGNLAKFPANEKLYRVLKRTYPKILVEASPYDRIWGIGLEAHDERAKNKSTWRGSNFLGYILTEVRDELMAKEGLINQSDRKIFLPELQKQYASAVKKSQGFEDTTGGWERYDQIDWRSPSSEEKQSYKNGPQSTAGGRGSQDRQQTPLSGHSIDYFMDNKGSDEKPLNNATLTQVVHPAIPCLVYAEEITKKKKKKRRKKNNEEARSKRTDFWYENTDGENFQVPEVTSILEHVTVRDNVKDTGKSSSADDRWEEVKGKEKGSPVEQQAFMKGLSARQKKNLRRKNKNK